MADNRVKQHSIHPIIDHNPLCADIAAGDPDDPNDDFTFGMMAESGSGICGPGHPLICLHCDNGTVWCPCRSAAVHTSKKLLEECIRAAADTLANRIDGAVTGFLLATLLCLAAAWPVGFLLCLTGTSGAYLIALRIYMNDFTNAVASCQNQHRIRMAGIVAAACGH
jgi:hypothetical protein